MLNAAEVATHNDLIEINKLNEQNLGKFLSKNEQEEQGFVTWLYPVSLLEQMHTIAPAIIVKDDDKVVGYALVALKEAGIFHADLQALIDHLEKIYYKQHLLSCYTFYIMGQVCIDKNYRGKGIFNMLFQKHKELYSDRYQLLVTEISTQNNRSQKAHEKIGFKTIHTYSDALGEWNVVVWDWR